jgi:hypothetical protein
LIGTAAVREADPIQDLELARIVISESVVPDQCGGLGLVECVESSARSFAPFSVSGIPIWSTKGRAEARKLGVPLAVQQIAHRQPSMSNPVSRIDQDQRATLDFRRNQAPSQEVIRHPLSDASGVVVVDIGGYRPDDGDQQRRDPREHGSPKRVPFDAEKVGWRSKAHDVDRREVESDERQAYLQLELEVGTVTDER